MEPSCVGRTNSTGNIGLLLLQVLHHGLVDRGGGTVRYR